jgi:hypothetical protein
LTLFIPIEHQYGATNLQKVVDLIRNLYFQPTRDSFWETWNKTSLEIKSIGIPLYKYIQNQWMQADVAPGR